MLLPLDVLKAGEWGEIADVDGEPAWVGRLAEMGIRTGSRVCVLQPGSPCLLKVSECSRLCLRGADSTQIFVRPCNGPS